MVTALQPLVPYEHDKLVDEEVEMQVYGDDGAWHRRAIGERTTACGEPITRGAQLRHNAYDGRLCPLCFTPFELASNDRHTNGER